MRPASGQMALLVEDNADVAEVAGDYLAQLGFSHRHARNADEALRLLRDQTVRIRAERYRDARRVERA